MRIAATAMIMFILLATSSGQAQTTPEICIGEALPALPALPLAERVLVISLDGARPDALLLSDTPFLHALARRGAGSWQAQTVLPSVTLVAHTSMLTGLSAAEHGVDWNDYRPDLGVIPFPTFLTLAERAGYSTALITGKEKFWHFQQTEGLAFTFARAGDRDVADHTITALEDGAQVVFAHFPNPDYFGHLMGWMSDTYLYELRNTDTQVGRVLTALDDLGLTETTLVIVTADHGGHDHSHGTDRPEDQTIPWLIAGPGVLPDFQLGDSVSVADTAPTVLWALGLPQPETDFGQPVCEAFGLDGPERNSEE